MMFQGSGLLSATPSALAHLAPRCTDVASQSATARSAEGCLRRSRLLRAMLLIATCSASGTVAYAQSKAHVSSTQADFGSRPVGSPSGTISLTFTFDAQGTIGSPAALTQGAPKLDFADTGTGSCTTNGTAHNYSAGGTCTVDVIFTPSRPGARYGGVNLSDSSGHVIATGYVYGTGLGPQLAYPAVQSSIGSGMNIPWDIAVDGLGNVYVADMANNRVLKETLTSGSYVQTVVTSNVNQPYGVAVDGGGNLFIADTFNNRALRESPYDGGYTESTVATGLNTPQGIAVDGNGSVYIADSDHGRVLKETPSQSGYTESTVAGGYGNPVAVAVDAHGNVYIADQDNGTLYKRTLSSGSYVQSTLSSSLIYPSGVAVDGQGNVYVASTNLDGLAIFSPSGSGYTQSSMPIDNGINTGGDTGVAVDGNGSIYVAIGPAFLVVKEDVTTPPTLSFAPTNVGSQSTDSPKAVTLTNIGNADLSFPTLATGNNPSLSTGFVLDAASTCPQASSTSAAAGTLTAGTSCSLAVDFVPQAGGTINGSVTLTDNNLNAAPPDYSQQAIPLHGTGQQLSQTISFATIATQTYGAPLTVYATASSQLAVSFTSTTPSVCTLMSNSVSLIATGTCSITASQGGDAAYSAASDVTQTFTVGKATATLTLGGLSQTYTGAPLSATATTAPAGLRTSFTYNGSATAPTTAGSYAVLATINDTNYQGTATGTLVIGKATPAVNWAAPAPITYGTALSGGQLNASSLVAGHFTYNPATGTVLNAGTQTLAVTFTPTDTTDYNAVNASTSLLVNQASQTATFTNPGTQVQGHTVTLQATSTSSNPISFLSNTPQVCTVSGNIATLVAVGPCSITAQQASTQNYLAGSSTQSFTVNPAFLFTAALSSPTFTAPGTDAVVLQLAPINGFTGTVSISCSGLPAGAKCPGMPDTQKLTGKGSVTYDTGVQFAKGTPAGSYAITYTAISGVYQNTATVTIQLQ